MDVTQLYNSLPPYGSTLNVGERRKQYPVVAVLNPGEGPDEQLMDVEQVTWDDEMGVMRVELLPR